MRREGEFMERRCMNCMNVFKIPAGYEDKDFCCPFCGFVENTPPEEDKYLNPGVVINERYTVGTVIAAGGFGVTYRAWDRILDSQIAIKEYYPVGLAARSEDKISVSVLPAGEKATFERGKERFLKEARSLAKFNNNPGTVTIYDFFEQNGTAYITMEYLDGCNMSEYIESEDASVSLDMIMDITDAICDVLSAVHSNGVIHRDISPENIFAEANGTYKLIDFGAAKQQISDEQSSLTVILKHDYAPLEQFSQKGNVGPWTDIYSLGASLYKILTGVTPKESIQRIMHDDIVDARKLRPDIPEYVSDAIMKAMAIQITDRFTSALDFKNAMHGEGKEKNAEKSDKGDVTLPENKNHKGGIEQQELDMGKELQEQALNESGNDSFLDINDFINFDDTEVAQQSTQILRQMQEQAAQDGSQILSAKPSQVPGGDASPQQSAPEPAPQQSAPTPEPTPEPAQHTGNTGTLSMSTPKMSLASPNNNVRKSKGISAVIEQQTNILRATDDAAQVAQAAMEAEGEKKRKGLGSLFGKKK
jgi:serine/threonine protein kinase